MSELMEGGRRLPVEAWSSMPTRSTEPLPRCWVTSTAQHSIFVTRTQPICVAVQANSSRQLTFPFEETFPFR